MRYKKKLITIAVGTAFLMSFGTSTFAHECKHCEHMMSKMDADGDGQISRTEFMRHHGEMFDKNDSNDDRFLDAGEVHDMMEKMHAEKQDNGHDHNHGDNDDHGHGHGHGDNGDGHGHGHGHGDNGDHHGHGDSNDGHKKH